MLKRVNPGHFVNFTQSRELTSTPIPKTSVVTDFHLEKAKRLYRKNLLQHYGCVNGIEFSNDGKLFVSAGDDRRVLLWDVHSTIQGQPNPVVMMGEHRSNIFVVAIDSTNSKIFSGGNDDLVIMHDVKTAKPLDYFTHEEPVYGISIDPLNDNLFSTACDNGQLLIHDIRDSPSSAPFCLATSNSAFHTVMFNPVEPRLVVSANAKTGVALWDVRMPEKVLINYGGKNSEQCCMCARFSQDGSKIIALRRRLPPILYSTQSTNHLFQFNHCGYYNSCTMKTCSFAGTEDQFVISGSDNFDLYMWKIPNENDLVEGDRIVRQAHLILRGHRSIVNQVRFNSKYSIIASAGVEKTIKFWSPFVLPYPNAKSSFETLADYDRRIYSNNDYINLILQSGQYLSFTYDTNRRTTREDPRMLAFFDALVQRDIEGMSDDDDFGLTLRRQGAVTRSTGTPVWGQAQSENPYLTSPRNETETVDEDGSNVVSDDDVQGEASDPDSVRSNAYGDDLTAEVIDDSTTSSDENIEPPSEEIDMSAGAGGETDVTCISSNSKESRETSKRSSELDEDEASNRDSREEEMKNNTITQLIAQKNEKLVRMAENHVILETEGRPLLKRRHMTILNRLRRLNRKTNSLTMNLLPYPEGPSPSDSSTTSSLSESSSATSSSSSTSSDDSDNDDDARFRKLKEELKPLLINASTSTADVADECHDPQSPVSPRSETRSRIRTARHRARTNCSTPKSAEEARSSDEDDKPCTSATALRRQQRTAAARQRRDKSSSSSCSDNTAVQTDLELITRLDEVSKRLKRVTNDLTTSSSILRHNRFNPKRKQQSTMIRCPSTTTTSSSSTSSDSSSSSTSSDSDDLVSIVNKLPTPAAKRRKLSNDVNAERDTSRNRPSEAVSSRENENQEQQNTSVATLTTRRRKASAKYRKHGKPSDSDTD